MRAPANTKPQERIIVALDVPTKDDAIRIVRELEGIVSFYKVGLELLMSGDIHGLIRDLVREKRVFLDLKIPNDIPETVRKAVRIATELRVSLLTLSTSSTRTSIQAAREGRGDRSEPALLFPPILSSMDQADLAEQTGKPSASFEQILLDKARMGSEAGVDGFIISGQEIALLRKSHPNALIVSPGIRPSWSGKDDHKRACTPKEALDLGADYLVIGRPIVGAPNRADAAKRVVEEISG
jgi:orotidine-5'-phosphate decarboxylase